MKKIFAALLISVSAAGCRSLPVPIPDFPSEQLLVNQPAFETAVQQHIIGNCPPDMRGAIMQTDPLGRSRICETKQP